MIADLPFARVKGACQQMVTLKYGVRRTCRHPVCVYVNRKWWCKLHQPKELNNAGSARIPAKRQDDRGHQVFL